MEFERVMRENGPRVYTLAVRLTGNMADGQDLAQETFVKAYENFSKFRNESSAGTWLYRICVNCWKNRVRYEKRRFFWRHFSLSAMSGDDDPPPRDIPAPPEALDQALEHADRQKILQEALARLDTRERAIVILRDMDDKT